MAALGDSLISPISGAHELPSGANSTYTRPVQTSAPVPQQTELWTLVESESYQKKLASIYQAQWPGFSLLEFVSEWRQGMKNAGQVFNVNQLALILAVMETGAMSPLGRIDAKVCELSEPYAAKQAQRHAQDGHSGFGERYNRLTSNGSGSVYSSEITAESWPNQNLGTSLMAHARDCVKSWLQSPGHKADMMRYHSRMCYSMAAAEDGTRYCVGLFADSSEARQNQHVVEVSRREHFNAGVASRRAAPSAPTSSNDKSASVSPEVKTQSQASPSTSVPVRSVSLKGRSTDLSVEAEEKIREAGANDAEIALTNAARAARRGPIGASYDSRICSIARDYAKHMASKGAQDGHQGFDGRFNKIVASVPGARGAAEITAQSDEIFNTSKNASLEDHAAECVRKWLGSSGHRRAVLGNHRRFCYTMVQTDYTVLGRGKPYFCVGLFSE